ncbi:MAG: hypothetical protein KDB73_10930 [Planctomycetes bacterium]|nr:hypothetical protein [Planctomycetota bacterium]
MSMVVAMFDVDCAAAHRGDAAAITSWWIVEITKIEAMRRDHPGAYVYRTRGGYRIVYVLNAPVVLATKDDAASWKVTYCTWVAYLKRRFGIVADHACQDWTRLYRLPHATRDAGGRPENREVIGSVDEIGDWECHPTSADEDGGRRLTHKRTPKRRSRVKQPMHVGGDGSGILFHALKARSELGQEIEPGKHAVVCPNETAHTSGDRFDTSTVLYAPSPGDEMGYVHCSHAHCQHLTIRDVLATFSESELADAREAAGLPKRTQRSASMAMQGERDGRPDVHVPGPHVAEGDPDPRYFEVSTADFTQRVIELLPRDQLYRMDSVVGILAGHPGRIRFVQLEADGARQLIDRHVRLIQEAKNRSDEIVTLYKPCTRDLANLVLAAAAISLHLRELESIVRLPCYLPGFVRARPGWNANGGVFYDQSTELVGVAPNRDGAIDVLRDLFVDFPFKDEASLQNMFGAMLTPLLRPALAGPVPFFLVLASLERTGKGKLIDTGLGMALTGVRVPMLQLSSAEEEREKRLTSELIGGTTTVHFDNVAGGDVLDSPALASLGTAWPEWRGRLLGKSQIVSLPNRVLVVLSGNNVKATGELCKRTVPIVLESPTPHPELRDDFIHPDILAYSAGRRRTVIEALLGLVEAWMAAGMPGTPIRLGGYERWVDAVGGILACAGCRDWMQNHRAWALQADDEGADAALLIERWADVHGTSAVTAGQILSMVQHLGVFGRVLASPTETGQRVSLGRRVIPILVDRHFGNWIVRKLSSGSSSKYALVPSPLSMLASVASSNTGLSAS